MPPADPRQHTAEHILTGIFGLLFQGKVLDTRFKGTKIRCDYEVKSDLSLEKIIKQAEDKTNKIIKENRDVVFEMVTRDEAAKLCSLHRIPDKTTETRLVKVGTDIITPCVGLHVKNTREIGQVKIRTFQWVTPGIIRLTFVVD